MTFTATATDQDVPAQTLTYALDPAAIALGMSMNPVTGEFNWTPTEAQGGSTYQATITVTDNGTNPSNLSHSETINITVNEVNVAPVLATIGDKSGDEHSELKFTATATDQDLPVQILTFSLVGAPGGANITESGEFTWTPTEVGDFTFAIRVTDDGSPLLYDEEEVTVTVNNVAPVIEVAKTTNVSAVPETGGNVIFTFVVTNKSVEAVTIISLVDSSPYGPLEGDADCRVGTVLAAGASSSFESTRWLEGPSDGPDHVNVFTATAIDNEITEASDADDATVDFVPRDIFLEPSLVTNGEHCSFDYHATLPGNQFRLLYHIEVCANVYRLNSTNPGQFSYNAFLSGESGSAVEATITVPFPFVTHGAVPIHLYSGFTATTNEYGYCLTPLGDITGDFTLTTVSGTLSPSGAETIVLADYSPQNVGSWTTVTVSGVIPASGYAYVTAHLEYGLGKTSGWTRTIEADGSDTATSLVYGVVTEPQSYTFGFDTGTVEYSVVTQSVNEFKKIAGVMGFVSDATYDHPVPGVQLQLWSPKNVLLGTQVTDEDGNYLFNYKHTGKQAYYTVKLLNADGSVNESQQVLLKANGFAVANFELEPETAPLQVVGGSSTSGTLVAPLTETSLASAVDQAWTFWEHAWVPADQLATAREHVELRPADLAGSVIAQAIPGQNVVEIDGDAAGFGWASLDGLQTATSITGVDLLSVMVHEFGHLLGFDHDVLGIDTLPVGTRYLPSIDYMKANRVPGDANSDGMFDQLDIMQVLQAAKYRTDRLATWSEGDWTGDGRFDQLDIVRTLQMSTYIVDDNDPDLADALFAALGAGEASVL